MHKTLQKLIFLFLVIGFLFPFKTTAQTSPLRCCKISKPVTLDGTDYDEGWRVGSGGASTCTITGGHYEETKNWTVVCLLSSIIVVTDWVFALAIIISGSMVILGAYTITTAAGSLENVNKGKKYILFAMVGFIIALFSKAIPDLVVTLIGG
jgi:hypothetical protein